ncbi:MAG: DUF4350 domain-containing protein [Thermoguttaceae bacterium]|jgi:hypothetical protein|nr:DUF4350 domain-containing protein [Thermoguttaceae bacterium]
MSRTNITAVLVLLTTAQLASAAFTRSSVPFIYVINYGDRWITDPEAAQVFGNEPPDVLHIGKAVPVTHLWGPVPYMAGENQSTGGRGHTLNRNAIRLLTPGELEAKIEQITAAVARLHNAGIPVVMPYICHMTMAGDHETREGLWAFYDRWDDYARWLGPRPPTDPTDWILKDATGKRIDVGYGYTPPYFEPLHRYGACPNNPSWNQFSAAIVRLIAQCGYDGVFVDNSGGIGGDGCDHCQAAFAKWVGEHFDEATLRRAFGGDAGEVALENPALATIGDRWHVAVIRDRLNMLREVGRETNPEFQVFPNVGRFQRAIPLGDGCDLLMFESTKPAGCLVHGEVPDDPEALVSVAADAEVHMATMRYDVNHEDARAEVLADITYPQSCPPGREVEFLVKVLQVGMSDRDNDVLRDMALLVTHMASGEVSQVALSPDIPLGHPSGGPGTRRPPVELRGTWIGRREGPHSIDITCRYADPAPFVQLADRLGLGNAYRVNLGGLAATYNSRSKMIGLSYIHGRRGWETVRELAIAEGAANGGRWAVDAGGEPQKKYSRFFRKHGQVAAGLVPHGDVTLLYAYWGDNPGSIGRASTPRTVAEHLSAQHVLHRSLVDRDLEAGDLAPAKGHTLVLVARGYDLTREQIAVVQDFVRQGGRLVVEHPETRVNFAPLAEVLGAAAEDAIAWDWHDAPLLGPALLPSRGRLRGVRFTAFTESAREPQRIVLHVVNYNVTAIDEHPGEVTPMADLAPRIPLPAGWTGARAVVYDPDQDAPREVDCTVADGVAMVTLPTLRVYQMLEMTPR